MDDKDKQKNQSYSMANKYYHGTKAQDLQTKPKKKKASVKKALITATCLTLAGTGLFFGGKAVYEKIKESQTQPDSPITGRPADGLPVKKTQITLNNVDFIKEANTISWDECEGASYYRVNVNGEVFTTKQNSVVLDIGTEQDFIFYVQAVGDGTYYKNSEIHRVDSKTAPENYPTYKKIVDNFKEIIEKLKAKSKIDVCEIYNIEVNENNVTAQIAVRFGSNLSCNYTSISIDLEDYEVKDKSMQALFELSKHLKQQKSLSFEMDSGYLVGTVPNAYSDTTRPFADAVLQKKLSHERLFGEKLITPLISDGYTLTPLYISYVQIGGKLVLSTGFRAKKDGGEKFVVIGGAIKPRDKQESQGRNYYKEFMNGDYKYASLEAHVYDSIPEYTSIYDKTYRVKTFTYKFDANSYYEKEFFGDLEETVANALSFYIEGKNKSVAKFTFPEAEQSM